ncbi:hypothetical protein, partial [Aquabacterium sp.]|uniref:hypothetical protein n=1 Tax=Aquabacterium sp. TaxID=1872578 RepID=UPI0025C4A617
PLWLAVERLRVGARQHEAGQSHSRPAAWTAASTMTGQSAGCGAYDSSTLKPATQQLVTRTQS